MQTSDTNEGASPIARLYVNQRRRHKAVNYDISGIDERPFNAMGIPAPESRADAAILLASMFADRRAVLEVCA